MIKELGQAVQQLRSYKLISRKDLADKMKIDYETLVKIEHLEMTVTHNFIITFCDALNLDISEFWKEVYKISEINTKRAKIERERFIIKNKELLTREDYERLAELEALENEI